MPTREGDLVVSHDETSKSMHSVWRVVVSGQQVADSSSSGASAIGGPAALHLARMMARERKGAIYLVDPTSGVWKELV
jgi:hypothetical protein